MNIRYNDTLGNYLSLNQEEKIRFLEYIHSLDPKLYQFAPLCEPLKKFLRHDD